jgi:antitoxin component YwqK of YwqJK toxin-antitoxin module
MDPIWTDRQRVGVELRPVEFSELDYDEGLGLYIHHEKEFSGTCSILYSDGAIESVTQMVDGAENGICAGWYPSGRIQFYRELSRGARHGKWLEWAEDGSLVSERRYVRGRLVPA